MQSGIPLVAPCSSSEPRTAPDALDENPAVAGLSRGVSDRIRTGDRLDHNQELYQLSYAHRVALNLAWRDAAEHVRLSG